MFRFICLGVSLLILIGCQQASDLSPGEGYIPLKDGQVWYKVVGEGEGTPLLLLHGGPGATSYYLNPMASLGVNRPIIFLDQLGCGRSKAKIDTSLMTIEHSVEQLEEFRKALGLDEFYL